MSLNIAIVMDPIESINYKKDTSLAMLWSAQARGHNLWYLTPEDLFLADGRAMATMQPLEVFKDPNHFYELGNEVTRPLAEVDAVLMRKDPPFDMNFIYATYLLEMAEREGTLIVNRPQSLRDCNEKLFATWFPQCCPPVMVASSAKQLRAFHQQHGDTIFKPLDGMGGSGIFRIKEGDSNIGVVLETLTEHGKTPIMAQRYLPEIKQGDKRILIVNGEVIPYALARLPSQGELRGNLAAGGTGVAQPLSERDLWIASQVASSLVEKGLLFVGLDVIGDYLTEINVTSPTCLREIEASYDIDIAEKLIIAIEQDRDN
ncbi:glutathione synthase [Umboniibacter marinipuniceus]|uniref:Glutathione synthetase n=1 Tax=Umboniibacter marinipuniceus TaxID=569599 RepID=A0A3M0AI22_9GAMM|nr:glutathione synthase [Umboniibacter marinipuniceus]RMA82225.1 glutathione synthase [Umboniibacter marinipuniceus]